jgi:hypothetical protein
MTRCETTFGPDACLLQYRFGSLQFAWIAPRRQCGLADSSFPEPRCLGSLDAAERARQCRLIHLFRLLTRTPRSPQPTPREQSSICLDVNVMSCRSVCYGYRPRALVWPLLSNLLNQNLILLRFPWHIPESKRSGVVCLEQYCHALHL